MMSKVKPYPSYSNFNQEWLGELPSHWKVMRTKLLFNLITEPAPVGNSEELLSVYTALGVKPRKDLEARGNKASSTDNYWRVEKGDIIVNKLLAWMGAIGISEYNGVTSPAYDILRANGDVNPYFYNYLFRNPIASREFKRHSRGIMDMRLRLYFTRFGDIKLPQPPLEEQNKIVDYLQFKLKKIDRFIRKKKQLIKLLNEQKEAIINHAVTKGIDPNAKLKPSGLQWLGNFPEHWKIVRLKYDLIIKKGRNPQSTTFEPISLPYLSMEYLRGKTDLPIYVLPQKNLVETNEKDILILWDGANAGEVIMSKKGYLSSTMAVLNVSKNIFETEFWYYFLKSNERLFKLDADGTTIPHFDPTLLKETFWRIPPVIEQQQIVSFIEKEIAIINTAISTIEREISLVEEYKTALIAEAVTGKIDVRDFVIPTSIEVEPYEELEEELSMVAEDEAEYETKDIE